MMAVYAYVKRKYNPLGKQGRWTSVEDNALKRFSRISYKYNTEIYLYLYQ